METSAHAILSQWESFYVIVGSSGAGLTGLMFVVITLAADSSVPRTPETLNAYGTPNVIHFGRPVCADRAATRSEEHTSELQSLAYLVCRLLLEKKKKNK